MEKVISEISNLIIFSLQNGKNLKTKNFRRREIMNERSVEILIKLGQTINSEYYQQQYISSFFYSAIHQYRRACVYRIMRIMPSSAHLNEVVASGILH